MEMLVTVLASGHQISLSGEQLTAGEHSVQRIVGGDGVSCVRNDKKAGWRCEDDVNIVTSKLRSTFASEATLSSSLLDTAATDVSLRQLLAALLHARYSLDSRLNDFTARIAQPQIPSVVAPRPKFLISHINGLDATRVTIRTRLEEFQSLFQLHESFRLRFSYQPFRISAKHLEGLQLVRKRYTFRFDAEWVERYSSAMRSMAKLWVDDLIKKATIPSLGRTQASLLQHLQILVDGELPVFQNAYPETYNLLLGLQAGIKKEIARERKHKFIIAFCGMVKAGKSLFINALMGRSILPSDELPSTAWPCRLRHVRGRREPFLRIDSAFFQTRIFLQTFSARA
ncbi:hypothetical protein A0H81_13701 [Grifola frondosa]|uniref:Dynamin N-terminal domain-containing protein n=1 Tax=Grifola frondosa TaxID=5627 RepID=A0A1C7LPE8_GRIFR|nr:hypothetical protein A0H81_13701 [Grifola frondosa]